MLNLQSERNLPVDVDPLDLQLDRLGAAPVRTTRQFPWQTRLAMGWSTGSLPAVLLLLLGAAFGPEGLGLLTPSVVSVIDPAVPVALAALGVALGLGIGASGSGELRLFAAACVEAIVTGTLVAAGTLFVIPAFTGTSSADGVLLALAIGICAATSSSMPAGDVSVRSPARRIKELDARLPIVAGALLLPLIIGTSEYGGLLLAAQAVGVALAISVAGWLLLTGSSAETEQRIFAVAALLLIGGAAEYLAVSALLSGVITGAFWQLVGGAARDAVRRDIGYVQHPLAVLLLLVAGAQVTFSRDALMIAVSYVLFRTGGKLFGGWLAGRIAGLTAPNDIGLHLTSPGVFGVALAMSAVRVIGPDVPSLLTVVMIGTIGSQLVSAFGRTREERL